MGEIDAWYRRASGTFQQNSGVYLERDIVFNLQDVWIVKEAVSEYQGLMEVVEGSSKHLNPLLFDLSEWYERLAQQSSQI